MEPVTQYYSAVDYLFGADYKKRDTPFIMTQYHYHNLHEIHYFTEGERRLFCRNKIYHITPGDLMLVKKYELHSFSDWDQPGHARILIGFKDEFFNEFPIHDTNIMNCFNRGIVVLHPNEQDKRNIESKMFEMVEEFSNKQQGYETMLRAYTINFLVFLDRIMDHYEDKAESPLQTHMAISKVMAYISEHYSEDLSLKHLSLQFCYSRSYLCSLFKKISGFSMASYINGIRIKNARSLLKHSDLSIIEIAQSCGFESSTHFGRVFREITGCSPSKYRKMIHQKP